MKKNKLIKDLKKDDLVNDLFVVKFKKPVELYKNGFKFELRLGDSSKEIMFKYWGPNDEDVVRGLYSQVNVGDVVQVSGRINEWNNALEISANSDCILKVLKEGEFELNDFVRISKRNELEMWDELNEIIVQVKNPELKKVLDHFFKDPVFQKKFRKSPAAMYIHHGWIHGLLEHTLDVAKICNSICNVHPELDRDWVITGAILHDIGKVEEFDVKSSITMTTEGMLLGHVTIATDMISKIDIPKDIKVKLIHMVLTHMGDYGSSKKPAFPEALCVYHADQLNADIVHMCDLKDNANTEDDYFYNKDFGNIYLK